MQTFLLVFLFASIGIAMEDRTALDLIFTKIHESKYFDIYKAEIGEYMLISQNPDKFHAVKTNNRKCLLYEINPLEKKPLSFVEELKGDHEKDLAISGKESSFLNNLYWTIPPAEYEAVKQVLDFDDRRLFFFRNLPSVVIMDSQNEFLTEFSLAGLWKSGSEATVFRNGNFALQHGDGPDRSIYYGVNKKPFLDTYESTCRLIVTAYKNQKKFGEINKLFPWAVFQNLFVESSVIKETNSKASDSKASKHRGSVEKDICLFRGSILFDIAQEAKHWSREDWLRVDKRRLLRPSTNKIRFEEEINDQYNDALFNAVTEGNVKKIDKLVKHGIDLKKVKNADGQTLSQYAGSNGRQVLEIPLKDSRYWPLFDQGQLIKDLASPQMTMPLKEGLDFQRSINDFIESAALGLIDGISWNTFSEIFIKENFASQMEQFNGTIIYWIVKNDKDFMIEYFTEHWSRIESSKLFENIRDVIPRDYLYLYLSREEINALYICENFADIMKIPENFNNRDEYTVAENDKTSLFNAIDKGNVNKIDKLVKKGIVLAKVKNDAGLTPFQYAREQKKDAFASALRNDLYWYLLKKEQPYPREKKKKSRSVDNKSSRKLPPLNTAGSPEETEFNQTAPLSIIPIKESQRSGEKSPLGLRNTSRQLKNPNRNK